MSNFWGAVQVSDGILLKNKRNKKSKGQIQIYPLLCSI
ncbi:hypothetical protein NEIFL0001_0772 [Neisseria flavescens SK114]|nr:hypothetical protein NEIFL0001_0772 [Neisseria flavescens SK114]